MQPTKLVIFDDGRGQWGPITDLRPVFELRTGTLITRERIERSLGCPCRGLIVPGDLAGLTSEAYPDTPVNGVMERGRWLLVNGRWPGGEAAQMVRELPVGSALVQIDGQVLAAHLEDAAAKQLTTDNQWQVPPGTNVRQLDQRVLLDRPWHILDCLDATLRADLDTSELPLCEPMRHDAVCFGGHAVRVAHNARLQPKVIFNAEQGPIVVDRGALIGAASILEGPCYIGRDSQVSCHAHIRPHTVVGPACKVAGEISHTILQGYSNKGHHGYLGHSLIGQWVNLGAATNVSNLKNTYGHVRVQLSRDTEAQDTGRVFQGPIIGDYTRTGIGTRLTTGSCVGTGTMIARSTYSPKFIDRFSFITDEGEQIADPDKFLSTAAKMMARRKCTLTPALETRLRSLAKNRNQRAWRAA